ncbi:hypothetical protein [Shimia sp.]|uniref:hypothetical protein n=1 Tax=Shimia sp. TaxID=1954381 RepID=UPI0032981FE6
MYLVSAAAVGDRCASDTFLKLAEVMRAVVQAAGKGIDIADSTGPDARAEHKTVPIDKFFRETANLSDYSCAP